MSSILKQISRMIIAMLWIVVIQAQTTLDSVSVTIPGSGSPKVFAISEHKIQLNFGSPPVGMIPAGSNLLIRISLLKYYNFGANTPNLNTIKYQIGAQSQNTATGVSGSLKPTYYEIIIPNINYSFGTLEKVMEINLTMQNARCKCRGFFDIIIQNSSGTALYTGTGNYLYSAEDSTACNINVNDNITGKKNLQSTISFQPKFDLQIGSNVKIQSTKWFSDIDEGVFGDLNELQSCSYIAATGQVSMFNPGFQCQNSASQSSISYSQINAQSFLSNQSYQLLLKLFRNPFSTMPEQITLTLEENVSGGYEVKEQCILTVNANISNKFTYTVFPAVPNTAQLVEQTLNFKGTSQTPFSQGNTFLRILYDSPMVITHTASSTTGTSNGSRMQIDIVSFISASIPTGTDYNFDLKIKSPPFARMNNIKFQIIYKKNNANYIQEEINTEYQFQTVAGVLETTLSKVLDPVIGATTEYTFKIKLNSVYPPGSKLYFNFSSASFILTSSSCSYVSGNISNSVTCTQKSSQEIETSNFVQSQLNPGDTFEIKINGVRNPLTTTLSEKIKIQTQTSTSDVIEENAGIQVISEPKQLLVNLNANVNNKIVYNLSSIAFEITTSLVIPANGFIEIIFPPEITFTTLPTLTNPSNLGSNTITANYPSFKIQINSQINASTTLSFTLVGIRNPPSFKASSSFIVNTQNSLGNILEQKKTGLVLTMNQKAITNLVDISASTQLAGESNVEYTFKITLTVPHTNINVFNISFPTEIQLNSSILCEAKIGLSNISCTQSGNSLKATVTFTVFPADSIVSFVVKTANNYIVSGVYSFSFSSETNSGDAIEANNGNFILKPQALTSVTGNNIQTKMTKNDNIYQITINPKTQLPSTGFPASNTSVEIQLPLDVNILGNSICEVSQPTGVTCTSDGVMKKFICKPVGQFNQQIIIQMKNIGFNYVSTGKSNSLIVSTAYNGNPIDQASSGLELIHNCNPNCFECTTPNSASCTSCFVDSLTNSYLLQGNSCKASCDQGFVALPGSQLCELCENNCFTCSIQKNNCTSCSGQYFLEGTNCVATCQQGYYGDKQTNKCLKCSFPCETCDGQKSYCLTCINDASNSVNIYAYNGTCLSSCPVDVSVQQGKICTPCTTNCIKCQNDPNNCVLCKDPYNLNGASCTSKCPDSTYPIGGKCQKCFDPCLTCSTGPSQCTSCIEPYYVYNGACVNQPCPNGTFQIDANRSCNSCSKGCSVCKSLTECTLCDSAGSYPILYNNQCLSECPQDKPFRTSTGCEECASSCLMCKGQKDYCTSCRSTLYLYSGQCLSECPSGFVKNSSTSICENPVKRETRVYFPYLIGAVIFLCIAAASKAMAKPSQFFTNAVAFTSIFEFLSWLTTGILMFNYNNAYEERDIKVAIGIFWFGFILYFITNIIAFIYIKKKFLTDIKFNTWRLQSSGHKHSTTFIQVITLIFSFKFFRFIYGRFLNRSYLSARFIDNDLVFKPTNFLSIISYIFSSTLIIAGSALSCYETQLIEDNLYYFSIEAIILTLLMLFFVIGDIFKESDYFQQDTGVDKKSRVYIDDGSLKKDPLMSVDVRNELEKNVLQKSLAYDRLNNSNLNNTNSLLKQKNLRNGQSSLQEIEGENLNESSLYNSMLNSQHKITKKNPNEMIKEEDNEGEHFKNNGNRLNGGVSPTKKNGISPSNSAFSPSNNGIESKRMNSYENISASKVLASAGTQTLPDRDSNLKKTKKQQSLKNLNKSNSKSPDRNDKNQGSNGVIQPSSRSPTNMNKTGSKMLESSKKVNDENGDQVLSGKDCHHLIRVYDKNGNSTSSKPQLNGTSSNIQSSPRGQSNSKSPAKSKITTKKSPKSGVKKSNQPNKNGKGKQNSQGLIGLDDEEMENANNDAGKQFNGLKNLKTYDSKVLHNGNQVDKNDSPKKPKNIIEDASGVQDDDDDENDDKQIIQDTPSNYNFLNMRYESKDLINMQLGNKPFQNNLLASTGMKTLPMNMSPLNYGSPIPLEVGYASTSSSQNYSSQVKNPIHNTFFTPKDSPLRQQQSGSSISQIGQTVGGNRTMNKKQLSITPSHQSYSHNNSPTKGLNNGHTYSITPTNNTFAHNGQNVVKTHSDFEEGIKISKILEQESNKKLMSQPFFMTQNMSQTNSTKKKQDYLDNYDYNIPHTTMNANNNNQNNLLTENSKVRATSNQKNKGKSSSRVTKTLEADPKIKQLEDIYNQKLVPSSVNPRSNSNQGSQNSRLRSNKKSVNGLMINDPANFSDYENEINPGYF